MTCPWMVCDLCQPGGMQVASLCINHLETTVAAFTDLGGSPGMTGLKSSTGVSNAQLGLRTAGDRGAGVLESDLVPTPALSPRATIPWFISLQFPCLFFGADDTCTLKGFRKAKARANVRPSAQHAGSTEGQYPSLSLLQGSSVPTRLHAQGRARTGPGSVALRVQH